MLRNVQLNVAFLCRLHPVEHSDTEGTRVTGLVYRNGFYSLCFIKIVVDQCCHFREKPLASRIHASLVSR